MVCRAAVKVLDLRQNKELTIPCHRHCDAFYILKEFGYKKSVDYKEIAQGFLNEHDEFMTRIEAWKEAFKCSQFSEKVMEQYWVDETDPIPTELYSEDLW